VVARGLLNRLVVEVLQGRRGGLGEDRRQLCITLTVLLLGITLVRQD